MARIAVIGGSGFIGSHTVEQLIRDGHDVTVADIVRPYNKDVRYINADTTNLHQIQGAVCRQDVVYILAACKYVNVCYSDPVYGINTNIQGLSNVLQACRMAKVERVIFASSVWVYNGCAEGTVDETTQIPAYTPGSLYGYTKVVGEGIVRNFQQFYDLDYTILRYGVAFGPGASDETVISKFINRALDGQPLVICGTGDVHRNFLYVTDHVRANILAMSPVAKNETFNVEGSEKITVKQVADTVKRLTNRDVTIEYTPGRAGEFDGKSVSTAKAKAMLGWEPTMSFDEGMKLHHTWEADKLCHV